MKTIIELKPINPLLRMLSIIYFVPISLIGICIYEFANQGLSSWNILIIFIVILSSTLLMFFRDFYSLKFYLINISITHDNNVYLQYYEWFKLKEIILPKEELKILKEQVISWRLRITINKKMFIKQYEGSWWGIDKWTRPMITDVYEKMKIELNQTK